MDNIKVIKALKILSIIIGLPFTIWLFFINWKIALCIIIYVLWFTVKNNKRWQ